MIDVQFVKLVSDTRETLARMADAKPSEIAHVRETFSIDALAILRKALAGLQEMSDAEKAAILTTLATNHIQTIMSEVRDRFHGRYVNDHSKDAYYLWESLRTSVLGARIFDATNGLESIFTTLRKT